MSKKSKSQSDQVFTSRKKSKNRHSTAPIPEPPKTKFHSLKSIFKPRSAGYPWKKATMIALSMGVPLLVGSLLGDLSLGMVTSIGALGIVYVNNEPYLQRALRLLLIVIGLMTAIGLGILAGGNVWLTAFTIGIVGMLAFFFCGAWQIPQPSGFFFVLVCAVSTSIPLPASEAFLASGLAGIGGSWAWLLGMAGVLIKPRGPEMEAVKNAYLEVAGFLASVGDPEADHKQHNAMFALRNAQEAVQAAEFRRAPQTGKTARLRKLIYRANALYLAGVELAVEANGQLSPELADKVRTLADAVVDPEKGETIEIPAPAKRSPARLRVKKELESARAIAKNETAFSDRTIRLERQSAKDILKSALNRRSIVVPIALRMGIAITAATFVAVLLGQDRPYWVPLTCAAVLNGATPANIFHRTIQRAVGTSIGIFLGAALLSVQPNPYTLTIFIMVLQYFIQFAIIRNYGFGVTFITPLALLMAESGMSGQSGAELIEARLFDTLIGCVIGLVAGLVLWNRASSTRLPLALSELIYLEGEVLLRMFQPADRMYKNKSGDTLVKIRRKLETALLNVRSVYDVASGEPQGRHRDLGRQWPAVVAAQRIGYLSVAGSKRVQTEHWSPAKLRLLEKIIRQLQSAAALQKRPHKCLEIPTVKNYPNISKELYALREALEA